MEIGSFDAADASLKFGAAAEEAALNTNVVVVGSLERLRDAKDCHKLQRVLEASPDKMQLITSVARAMSAKKDGASARELYLLPEPVETDERSGSVRRVCLIALPSACSRHNSPARPHALTSCLKGNAGPGSLTVVAMLDDPSLAFATGCAIVRAFPTWVAQSSTAAKMQSKKINVIFDAPDNEAIPEAEIAVLSWAARAIRFTARLVDVPCNILNTTEFVNQARVVHALLQSTLQARGEEANAVSLEVITGEDLAAQGFGGLYGVGKAAAHPPALAILKYYPPGTSAADQATIMVGKGIVYDTGGLSLKGKTGMPGMKKDMGGAGGLLGTFRAAVGAGVPKKPLYCLLCLAENAIGPLATRPDDVHTFYSGLTVEINNTDAEGRLVLSDGLAFAAKTLNPHVLINMCTLTGAQGVATGQRHAALYCNDEDLEASVIAAGKSSGDLAHGMPYCPEFYRGEFTSKVADMKNSVANRSNAQVSCAAQFIGNHLREYQDEGKWVHIDMASPASSGERATGYGVALLVELIRSQNW